ncbi:MAG: NfeD family protein [Chthoniobacterales bacterium]
MRRFLLALAVLGSLASFLQVQAADFSIAKGDVVVVPLKGEIGDAQFFFLRRSLKAAEAAGASAYIIEMDTPGGKMSSAVKILNLLLKSSIPTATYVDNNAGSAGALIALGTKSIYMAPVSAIGAAAPVLEGGQDVPETLNSKIVSYYSGYFRSAAQRNGYNPEIAEAFIDKDKEVKLGGVLIHPSGKPLTLSAQEATRLYAGKPLFAKGIADSLSDIVKQAGYAGVIVKLEPSGFEKLALFITTLAPLFLLGGILGVYLELKAPGFALAGFCAAICFLLFFAGHYIAGLTGYETAVVFVVGILLVGIEVFFFPGSFVMILSGLLLIMGSLLFAMIDRYPGQPFIPSAQALYWPVSNLAMALLFSTIAIVLLARFFPDIPLFRRLVLRTPPSSGPSHVVAEEGIPLLELGTEGVAITILRPAGKALFDGHLTDVVTDGSFIEKGERIRVVEAGKDRIVVRPA